MSHFGIDPYSGTSKLPRNTSFNVGDRFEFETFYEDRTIIHRGRITKIERFDFFEDFLKNGSLVCGNTHSLNKTPRHKVQTSKTQHNT